MQKPEVTQREKFRLWLYPELRFLKTREARKAAQKAFGQRPKHVWKVMLGVIPISITAAAVSIAIMRMMLWLGVSIWLGTLINALIWAIFGAFAGAFFWRRPYILFLRRYLQDQGVPVCLKCGYDLRGLNDPRCPECGEAFDERLLKPMPDQERV